MHTPILSAWLFASDVAQRLRDNARELSKLTGIKAFCSALESELAIIAQHLEDVGVVESDTGVGEPRLVKLLENLERLCQVTLLALLDSPGQLTISFSGPPVLAFSRARGKHLIPDDIRR